MDIQQEVRSERLCTSPHRVDEVYSRVSPSEQTPSTGKVYRRKEE